MRERLDGTLKDLTALCNRRSPWVRLEAIRNLRVLATGVRGAANDDPRALLRYLFALARADVERLEGCARPRPACPRTWSPGRARFLVRVRLLRRRRRSKPAGPDDPPDLVRGKEVRLVWEVDALFAWTLEEFEDYLASERYSLPTTTRVAAVEDLDLPVVDVPSEALRRGNELFGGQGGGPVRSARPQVPRAELIDFVGAPHAAQERRERGIRFTGPALICFRPVDQRRRVLFFAAAAFSFFLRPETRAFLRRSRCLNDVMSSPSLEFVAGTRTH